MQILEGWEDLFGVYTQDFLVAAAERFVLWLQAVRHHLHENGGLHLLLVQHAPEILYDVRVAEIFE